MDTINNAPAQPVNQPAAQPEITQSETTQPAADASSHLPGKRRGGKMAKLKRSSESFRPGSATQKVVPTVPVKEKTLVFLIPADHEHGKVEEFEHIHRVVTQIAAFPQIGEVTSIAIHDKTWEITLKLAITDGVDDEKALSEAFRTLMPTIDASSELRNGFCIGNSSNWEYRIGTFVADEGGF